MIEDYRKSYRVFLILFLISCSINLIFLGLFWEGRIQWGSLPQKRNEAKESQKGKGAEEKVLAAVVHLRHREYLLLCEKNSKALYLFHSEPNRLSLIKSYPCIVGSNHVDKKEAGDLATPEGIYFLLSFLSGESLPEKYGDGAFSLNYPNLFDRMEGKKGSGIWLHGFPITWNVRSLQKGVS